MKKIITIIALGLAGSLGAYSQGLINFANGASGLNAPVKDTSGVNLASGSGYLADLFYIADPSLSGSAPLSSMTDAGYAAVIGSPAGIFLGGAKTLPVSGNILFEVVVWKASAGASWAAATGGGAGDAATYNANGGVNWGFSNQFQLTPNVSPSPNSNLSGLLTFNLVATPEPATLALGGLGAAALLLFRRRK